MARSLEAVFFDFGGTLFSYDAWRRQGFGVVVDQLRELGVDAPPREVGRAYARASARAFERYLPQPYYLHADLFRESFVGMAGEFEIEPDEEAVARFLDSQREIMLQHVALRSDCIATLRRLRERGLVLAIVSNIDDDYLVPMVERLGLDAHLDHWWSSEQARSCKPDPGFFRYALEGAGVVPEAVLFVGDSPEADVAGGRGVGMKTALIREGEAPPPGAGTGEAAEPHYTIEALSELLPIADTLRG